MKKVWFENIKSVVKIIFGFGLFFIILWILSFVFLSFYPYISNFFEIVLSPISPILNQVLKVFYSAVYLFKNILYLFVYLFPVIMIVAIFQGILKMFFHKKK